MAKILSLVFSAAVLLASPAFADRFIAGADMSGLQFFEQRGKQYRDGSQTDALAILKSHGINFIRLRLETSSDELAKAQPYNSGNNLTYTLPLAVRVNKAGLPWMLDFFYSDRWADPGQQHKPKSWEGLGLDQLNQRMYEYNRDCIAAFRKAGAMPRFVQVGNEITNGMLWPDARTDTPEHWANLARLIKYAIMGIRESAGDQMPKIVIHMDHADNARLVQWFFDHLRAQGVAFDIIGVSYYPDATSRLENLKRSLDSAARRFDHPVMIAETAFPTAARIENGSMISQIEGFDLTPEGQAKYAQSICDLVASVPDGKGIGVFWWGGEYQPITGFNLDRYDRSSMFDGDGNARPMVEVFGRFARR